MTDYEKTVIDLDAIGRSDAIWNDATRSYWNRYLALRHFGHANVLYCDSSVRSHGDQKFFVPELEHCAPAATEHPRKEYPGQSNALPLRSKSHGSQVGWGESSRPPGRAFQADAMTAHDSLARVMGWSTTTYSFRCDWPFNWG